MKIFCKSFDTWWSCSELKFNKQNKYFQDKSELFITAFFFFFNSWRTLQIISSFFFSKAETKHEIAKFLSAQSLRFPECSHNFPCLCHSGCLHVMLHAALKILIFIKAVTLKLSNLPTAHQLVERIKSIEETSSTDNPTRYINTAWCFFISSQHETITKPFSISRH